ncbi:hypothetical protein RIF29_29065 [Crotalaria pallida]|uniref:Uncharacterized protein n=1 Tax=Crotalaria pallida TaxID=3830 RepID=A0AAN9EG16_CROPI
MQGIDMGLKQIETFPSGPNHTDMECGLPSHMTRPPDCVGEIPSPSSLSIKACLEAEEAYQKSIRGNERHMGEIEVESSHDMELEFVPDTQEFAMETARDSFDIQIPRFK